MADKFASYIMIAALVRNHRPTIKAFFNTIESNLLILFKTHCFKIFVVRILKKVDSPGIRQIMHALRKADRRQLQGHRDFLLVYWLCVLTFAASEKGGKEAADLADQASEELQIGRQCIIASKQLPYKQAGNCYNLVHY